MTTSDVDTGTGVAAARSNGSPGSTRPERPPTRDIYGLGNLVEAALSGRSGAVLDLPEGLSPRERALMVLSIFNYPLFEGVGSDDKYTFCPGHESSGMHEPSLHINFYGSMEQGDKNSLGDNFFSYCLVCQTSFYPNIMSGNIPECTAVEHPAGMDNRSNQAKAYARGSRMSSYQVHDEESYNKWCRQVARENSGYPYVVRSHEYALGEYVKEKWSDGVWVWLRRVSGGKYFKSLSGHQDNVPLYGADFLSPSGDGESREYVLAVEGEKDSDCARSLGFDSVSFHTIRPFRSDNEHLSILDGRNVYVIADNDEAGLVRANRFARVLADRGINVQIVEGLVGDGADDGDDKKALKGFDLSDWVSAQGDSSDVVERLTDLLGRLAVRVDGSVHAGRVGSDGVGNVYGDSGQVLAGMVDSSGGSDGSRVDGQRVSEVAEQSIDNSLIDSATKRFEQDVAKQRYRTKVLTRARLEDSALTFTEPPEDTGGTLDALLKKEFVARPFYIDKLLMERHIITITGQAKSGKTTLTGNVVKSLVDGNEFLNQFAVNKISGRVGMWNCEMDEQDYITYLAAMNIQNTGAVAIKNLRGYPVSLMSDAGSEWTIKWLNVNDVEVWIPDPWSNIVSWADHKENDNSDLKNLQTRIMEILRQTNVKTVLIPTHPNKAEGKESVDPSTRGAQVMEDWPDALWKYVKDDEKVRSLYVYGRGVDLPATGLSFDSTTNSLSVRSQVGESPSGAVRSEVYDKIMAIVSENKGINQGEICKSIGGNKSNVLEVLNSMERSNILIGKKFGTSKRYFFSEDIPNWDVMGIVGSSPMEAPDSSGGDPTWPAK